MSFLYVKIICYKNVSYFQPIFLIPAKTDYIIGCKSDTKWSEYDKRQVMQSEAKKRSEKMQGYGRKNSGVDFLRGGSFVYCDMGDASRADAGGERTGCCGEPM